LGVVGSIATRSCGDRTTILLTSPRMVIAFRAHVVPDFASTLGASRCPTAYVELFRNLPLILVCSGRLRAAILIGVGLSPLATGLAALGAQRHRVQRRTFARA